MAVPEFSYVTVYFPSQISSVSSGKVTVTESGNVLSVERNNGENAGVITCMIENGYKISNAVWTGADSYNNLSVTFENNVITLHDDGQGSKSGSLTITVEQSNPKAVSLDNLQTFKEKCDETYAKKTEIPEAYTLPVANASTLGGVKPVAKTSEMTQNVGVDSNGALYTKPAPDIPDIPEPTSADAGKVLAVNSAGNGYELVEQSGGTIEYMTDAEVDALFINITTFANTSWKDIDIVSRAGLAEDYFAVGDEKTIELTTGEQITLVILGFNHDDLSDGSGKAGITIGMKELLATTYRMNATRTNAGGWDESNMRTSTMATLLSRLPSDLQAVIKQVNKKTTDGNGSSSITTSADKLWLPSMVEIIGTTMAGYVDEGEQYEYWQTVKDGTVEADRIKRLSNGTGDAKVWWLRSPQINSTYYWCQIDHTGFLVFGSPTSLWGVCFGFCI